MSKIPPPGALNVKDVPHASPSWDETWKRGNGLQKGEMFDTGTPSPALVREIESGRVPEGAALVPGCGRGYDVVALSSPTRVATGVELSRTAVEAARAYAEECGSPENARFEEGNFFELRGSYDFVYDYTFLCALDPSVRKDWASQMSALVKPGGLLMTLIFPINEERPRDQGPPFPVTLALLEQLLAPVGFEKLQLEMLPSDLCHPNRDGKPGGRIQAASGIGRWRRT